MLSLPWLLAQQAEPFLQRVDPRTRVRLLAGLGVVVMLGVTMLVIVVLIGRATRKYMRHGALSADRDAPRDADDWARKPLVRPYEGPSSTES